MSQLSGSFGSGGGGGGGTATTAIGLVNPRSAPYNAICDGVTDDAEAFSTLHEAVNAGTIPGYYVPGPVKIGKKLLPQIKKSCQVVFFANSYFDLALAPGETGSGIAAEGELAGSTTALTEDVAWGAYRLKMASGNFADGTLLKLTASGENWDTSTSSKQGEIVEVGVPDGGVSAYKAGAGAFVVGDIPAGAKLTQIAVVMLHPKELVAGVYESILPLTGEIELEGQVYKYTGRTTNGASPNAIVFEVEEQEVSAARKQGSYVRFKPESGTIYLRKPVTHELGYKVSAAAKVREVKPITVTIQFPWIKGPGSKNYTTGIAVYRGVKCKIVNPKVENCWGQGVLFNDTIESHIENPTVENARWQYYESAGLEGYGISFIYCTQDCTVKGGRTTRTRHAYTQGGGGGEGLPRRNKVIDHIAWSTFADAYDSHGGAYDITFENCTAMHARGQAFNINCPKARLIKCRAIKPEGYGVLCQSVTPIGATEYDVDCDVFSPFLEGIRVSAQSSTNGKVQRFIRIRGTVDAPREHGVHVEGSDPGGSVNYYMENVDVDVHVSNGPTKEATMRAAAFIACKGLRARVSCHNVPESRTPILVNDCSNFTIDVGFLSFTGTTGNKGVLIKASAVGLTTKGVIREGPITNLGAGKSTEIESASVERVFVYPGPDEAVENKGAATCKVCTIP